MPSEFVEEPLEAIEVRCVEGGTAPCVERRVLKALRVAAGEDDAGSLGMWRSATASSGLLPF